MKNIKFIIAVLSTASLAVLGSCSDYLDVKPAGKLIPEKVADYDYLMNNTSIIRWQFQDGNNYSRYAFLADNFEMNEVIQQAVYPSGGDVYGAYVFYNPIRNPIILDPYWQNLYSVVNIFNTIVDGIADLPESESNSEAARWTTGQARAARAWSFLHASVLWGPMWNPNGANDTPVMPYRRESSPLVSEPSLNTTAEMFAFVKEDLDYALASVPDAVANPTRANKAAVKAIMAQYYMYQRNWPEMLRCADEAWKESLAAKGGGVNKLIYDFKDFRYIDTGASAPAGEDREVYLSIGYYPDGVLDASEPFNKTTNREALFFRSGAESFQPTKGYKASEEYINLFDPATDRRYQLFMLNVTMLDGTIGKNYYRSQGSKLYDESQQGISYPLLLLMRAEAYARTGSLPEALADLNTLRKYRYDAVDTDLPNGGSLSQESLLYEILQERRREQDMGSFGRLADLKRYQFDDGPWKKEVINHKYDNKVFSKPITDPIFNGSIDNVVISYNPQWGLEPDTRPYLPVQ